MEYSDDLKIECDLISFDRGSRALRYFVGWGDRSATAAIKITLLKDGKIIATFDNKTVLSGGIFGGDSDNTIDIAAEKLRIL